MTNRSVILSSRRYSCQAPTYWNDLDILKNFESTSHFHDQLRKPTVETSPNRDLKISASAAKLDVKIEVHASFLLLYNVRSLLRYHIDRAHFAGVDALKPRGQRAHWRCQQYTAQSTIRPACFHFRQRLSAILFAIAFSLYYCITFAHSAIMLNSDQSISDDARPAMRIKYAPFVRINRCYSCMSAIYEPFFRAENSHLAKFFYEPRNFTAYCDDSDALETYGVGVVPCRAICLTLTQEFTVMGRKTGKRLTMRGCATSFSRYGFYNRTFALFDQYDLCREVLANELFRYDTDSQLIRVCSCLGDRCNGAAAARSPRFISTVGLALTVMLAWLLNRRFIFL